MTDVLMPALSPTMEEGTLAKWLVKVGDTVKSGDVIAEIETDKATMEVEAVDEGVVESLLVPEGTEEVKVNTPIARLSGESPSPSRGGAGGGGLEPVPPTAQGPTPPEPAAEAPTPAPSPTSPRPPTPSPQAGGESASPLARRLAKLANVDLSEVKGSGPHGRIIRRDIEGLRATPAAAPTPVASVPPTPAAPPSLESLGIPPGSYDLVPLDGMRRTVARRLTDSFRDIPHFPLSIDLEVEALIAARAQINAALEKTGAKVSLNDMLIKTVAVALKRVPEANASYTPDGIALHHHADIAVAVAVEGGLITPIVRAAETKGLAQIASETRDLAERARARKLKPEEFQGGTFTVSNLGMFGIRSFSSIINPPQGAILSVGAAEKRPVARGDELAVATVISLTLTCDHRVIDGAIGARFLAALREMVAEPLMLLA